MRRSSDGHVDRVHESLITLGLDTIEHLDSEIRDKIRIMTPEERGAKKINKSTLWHQKKMLNQGKALKVYDKARVKINDN